MCRSPPACKPHDRSAAGNAEGLRELLKQDGADANQADEEGRTALHFASGYNEVECMQVRRCSPGRGF